MPTTKQKTFVLCVKNDECEDLELRKVDQLLPDSKAAKDGYMRIVDESGEDYLYPESYFAPLSLSPLAQEAMLVGH
jgi:hypothetical protein